MTVITGGCLCGDIRYEASALPKDTGYCHCRMCQRQSGATALPFATFALESFAYVRGTPQVYVSSDHGERRFCPRCSASIDYRERSSPTEVSINAGTLDDPGLAPPRRHIWTESRIAWFVTGDDLPATRQG